MDIKNSAQEILESLLSKVGIKADVMASQAEDTVLLTLASEQQSILIGHHGENLQALQTILRAMVYRLTGEWQPILVDVGGYRAERTQKLQEMATRQAEKARFLHDEASLPPMSNADRREVHLIVAGIEGVESESVGEGNERHVVIRPQ